jgi:hypothetical protein
LAARPALAIWGVIATIIPLCNLYFMIFKP